MTEEGRKIILRPGRFAAAIGTATADLRFMSKIKLSISSLTRV